MEREVGGCVQGSSGRRPVQVLPQTSDLTPSGSGPRLVAHDSSARGLARDWLLGKAAVMEVTGSVGDVTVDRATEDP